MDNINIKKEEEKLFSEMNKRITTMNELIYETVNVHFSNFVVNIPNIAVQYNNKLVELVHLFEKNGMSFYDSLLMYPISVYFLTLYNKGISCLKSSNEKIDKLKTRRAYLMSLKKTILYCDKKIDEYIKIDDIFYKFDINENIIDAIKCYIEISNNLSKNLKMKNVFEEDKDIIDKYNKELKTLGCDVVILENILNIEEEQYNDVYKIEKIKSMAKMRNKE